MLQQITIKNIATFDEAGASFNPQQVNFIFGNNGSGKTTIGNVIADISKYPSCSLKWQQKPLETLVYNRRFVHQNFGQPTDIRGIFTFGENNIAEIENIATNQAELNLQEIELQKHQAEIEIKNNDLEKLAKNFKEIKCWENIYKKYELIFKEAFKSYKTKEKFADKILFLCRQYGGAPNTQAIPTYEELAAKAQTILNDEAVRAPQIQKFSSINFTDLEQNPILSEIIIGKNDVDIAGLITNLQNSDWVKSGTNYLKINDQNCPFCQQQISTDFKQQLDKYFDQSYQQKIAELEIAQNQYRLQGAILLDLIQNYQNLNHQFINADALSDLEKIIRTTHEKNLLTVSNKIKEPSLKIQLDSISPNISKLQSLIELAIASTNKHNALIDNIKKERELLINQIWDFVADQAKDDLKKHLNDQRNIETEIENLQKNERFSKQKIRDLKNTIAASEAKITSIMPAIEAINSALVDVGFTNFSLTTEVDQSSYKIVRANGEDAKKTLSEGEKTLITFLYFYYLTSGGFDQNDTANQRVVVLDDPISSLDDNILKVVANLTKKLIDSCRKGGKIKQIFILTHNSGFWKELAEEQNDALILTIQKINNKSQFII